MTTILRNTHVDVLLTDQAIAFARTKPSTARRLIPFTPTDKQSNLYPVWGRGSFLRDDMRPKGRGDEAPIWRPDLSNVRYVIQPEHLKAQLIWDERDNANDPAQYERGHVLGLVGKSTYAEDRIFAATYMLNTSWASSNRYVGVSSNPSGQQFLSFAQSGSDPYGVIELGRAIVRTQTGGQYEPNKLVVSPDVDRVLRTHPSIITRALAVVQGGGTIQGAVSRAQMAAVLGVDQYEVLDASRATSVEGAAVTVSDLSSGTMVLAYLSDDMSDYAPSAARVYEWSQGRPDGAPGSIRRFKRPEKSCDEIQIETAITCQITSDVSAVHFASCLA